MGNSPATGRHEAAGACAFEVAARVQAELEAVAWVTAEQRVTAPSAVAGPRVVHLHIGSTKTGTTFIQRVLWANQEALEKNGVTLPAKGQFALGRAARALHHWSPADDPIPDDWTKIAGTVNRSRSASAIISQEL